MIYNIENLNPIRVLPHKEYFEKWIPKVPIKDFDNIILELNSTIDNKQIHTSGWIPGNDWTGTVYEPLYIACGRDKDKAALLFGIIVFKVFMERDDAWGVGRYSINGKDIGSLTYYSLKNL